MWRFAGGTARYGDDGTRRTLSASVGWISSWAGRSLDLYVNGVFQASVVIPASGTPSYSADTNLGDSVPVLSAGADISWVMPDTLETISEGVLG